MIRGFPRLAQRLRSSVVKNLPPSVASVTSVDEKAEPVEEACKFDCVSLGYPQISRIFTDVPGGRRGGSRSACDIRGSVAAFSEVLQGRG